MLVVFGSINVDVIMRVPRHPGPGETVLGDECVFRPGGKGANQAVAAARAGASVAIFGAVGDDAFGQQLRDRLAAEKVDASGVATSNRSTGCATVVVDAAGENAIAVAPGANFGAAGVMVPESRLGPEVIVLAQMEVPAAENWALLRRARDAGSRNLLNLAPAESVDEAALAAIRETVDYLIVNRGEAAALASACLSEAAPADPAGLASALAAALGVAVVATLGGEGAVCALPNGGILRAGALPVSVVDSTGAGDAFCGAFAAALDRGTGPADALAEAAAAGSLACRAVGAQEGMPPAEEIAAALERAGPGRSTPAAG